MENEKFSNTAESESERLPAAVQKMLERFSAKYREYLLKALAGIALMGSPQPTGAVEIPRARAEQEMIGSAVDRTVGSLFDKDRILKGEEVFSQVLKEAISERLREYQGLTDQRELATKFLEHLMEDLNSIDLKNDELEMFVKQQLLSQAAINTKLCTGFDLDRVLKESEAEPTENPPVTGWLDQKTTIAQIKEHLTSDWLVKNPMSDKNFVDLIHLAQDNDTKEVAAVYHLMSTTQQEAFTFAAARLLAGMSSDYETTSPPASSDEPAP